MMKAMPWVRSATQPSGSATTAVTPSVTSKCSQPACSPMDDRMATEYAPRPMYMAWPRLTMPPKPSARFRPSAASENTRMRPNRVRA